MSLAVESRPAHDGAGRLDTASVRLLYAVDYAPGEAGGGATVMGRLLSDFGPDSLTIVTSRRRAGILEKSRFADCPRLLFPEITGQKCHGTGRIKLLLDRALIPVLAVCIAVLIARRRPSAVVTVAHGYFFLAATLAAVAMRVPVITIVHDDWTALNEIVYIFRRFSRPLLQWALRRSAHVYAISEAMRLHLHEAYGVRADLQLPSTLPNPYAQEPENRLRDRFQLVFAGNIADTVRDSLDALIRVLKEDEIRQGLPQRAEIVLCTQYSEADVLSHGWTAPSVRLAGWLEREDYLKLLAEADVLVLPLAFAESAAFYAATSFPSKLADYLAAGKPVLVIAPPEAPITDYAKRNGFAEVVTTSNSTDIVGALKVLMHDSRRRNALGANALRSFENNHSIVRQREEFRRRIAAVAAVQDSGNS